MRETAAFASNKTGLGSGISGVSLKVTVSLLGSMEVTSIDLIHPGCVLTRFRYLLAEHLDDILTKSTFQSKRERSILSLNIRSKGESVVWGVYLLGAQLDLRAHQVERPPEGTPGGTSFRGAIDN